MLGLATEQNILSSVVLGRSLSPYSTKEAKNGQMTRHISLDIRKNVRDYTKPRRSCPAVIGNRSTETNQRGDGTLTWNDHLDVRSYPSKGNGTGDSSLDGIDISHDAQNETTVEKQSRRNKSKWRRKSIRTAKKLVSSSFGIFLILIVFMAAGAGLFMLVERGNEDEQRATLRQKRREHAGRLASNETCQSDTDCVNDWLKEWEKLLADSDYPTAYILIADDVPLWQFENAFHFCFSVVTTIGYGNITPLTTEGRLLCVVYAIFGIPLMLLFVSDIGTLTSHWLKKCLVKVHVYRKHSKQRDTRGESHDNACANDDSVERNMRTNPMISTNTDETAREGVDAIREEIIKEDYELQDRIRAIVEAAETDSDDDDDVDDDSDDDDDDDGINTRNGHYGNTSPSQEQKVAVSTEGKGDLLTQNCIRRTDEDRASTSTVGELKVRYHAHDASTDDGVGLGDAATISVNTASGNSILSLGNGKPLTSSGHIVKGTTTSVSKKKRKSVRVVIHGDESGRKTEVGNDLHSEQDTKTQQERIKLLQLHEGGHEITEISARGSDSNVSHCCTKDKSGPPLEARKPDNARRGTTVSSFSIEDDIDKEIAQYSFPWWMMFLLLCIYLLIGMTMFHYSMNWSLIESFYYSFVSLSTIGFGDIAYKPSDVRSSIYYTFCYCFFGLCFTSMIMNLCSRELVRVTRRLAWRIGYYRSRRWKQDFRAYWRARRLRLRKLTGRWSVRRRRSLRIQSAVPDQIDF